ncbi:hypothetical protein K438DRAFT_1763226 [Mycena galopus ATCC 62051]|nr:hypothetical protein K438DRAFT_1763226 [Mycena galopus ATCC 62051]
MCSWEEAGISAETTSWRPPGSVVVPDAPKRDRQVNGPAVVNLTALTTFNPHLDRVWPADPDNGQVWPALWRPPQSWPDLAIIWISWPNSVQVGVERSDFGGVVHRFRPITVASLEARNLPIARAKPPRPLIWLNAGHVPTVHVSMNGFRAIFKAVRHFVLAAITPFRLKKKKKDDL